MSRYYSLLLIGTYAILSYVVSGQSVEDSSRNGLQSSDTYSVIEAPHQDVSVSKISYKTSPKIIATAVIASSLLAIAGGIGIGFALSNPMKRVFYRKIECSSPEICLTDEEVKNIDIKFKKFDPKSIVSFVFKEGKIPTFEQFKKNFAEFQAFAKKSTKAERKGWGMTGSMDSNYEGLLMISKLDKQGYDFLRTIMISNLYSIAGSFSREIDVGDLGLALNFVTPRQLQVYYENPKDINLTNAVQARVILNRCLDVTYFPNPFSIAYDMRQSMNKK